MDIPLSYCIYGGISMETLYNLGRIKQKFDFMSYPVPYNREYIVGLSRASISAKVYKNKGI